MENLELYELSPAQEVPALQCKYTLFKRVINILASITSEDELDFEIEQFNRQVLNPSFNETVLTEIARNIDPE